MISYDGRWFWPPTGDSKLAQFFSWSGCAGLPGWRCSLCWLAAVHFSQGTFCRTHLAKPFCRTCVLKARPNFCEGPFAGPIFLMSTHFFFLVGFLLVAPSQVSGMGLPWLPWPCSAAPFPPGGRHNMAGGRCSEHEAVQENIHI